MHLLISGLVVVVVVAILLPVPLDAIWLALVVAACVVAYLRQR